MLGTPKTGTHYLIGDSPAGPWSVAPLPLLDMDEPCQRYAARIVETSEGLRILGFADRRQGKLRRVHNGPRAGGA